MGPLRLLPVAALPEREAVVVVVVVVIPPVPLLVAHPSVVVAALRRKNLVPSQAAHEWRKASTERRRPAHEGAAQPPLLPAPPPRPPLPLPPVHRNHCDVTHANAATIGQVQCGNVNPHQLDVRVAYACEHFLRSRLVIRVFVRMMFPRQPPEGLRHTAQMEKRCVPGRPVAHASLRDLLDGSLRGATVEPQHAVAALMATVTRLR